MKTMQVDVVVQASNTWLLTGDAGQRVTVPAATASKCASRPQPNGRHGPLPDRGGIRQFADAATVELPVYTPATTEAFATYGVVDEGAIPAGGFSAGMSSRSTAGWRSAPRPPRCKR
jgi:alpha-2-macroglobulin